MPHRWCACTGCRACSPRGRTHGVLFNMDDTGTLKCPPCQQQATAARNARPSGSQRGLGWAFSKRKRNDQNYQQASRCQCPGCPQHRGVCGETFTVDNPKTAGHVVARSRGGADGPILAVCRRCNSSDCGRLAHERRNRTLCRFLAVAGLRTRAPGSFFAWYQNAIFFAGTGHHP